MTEHNLFYCSYASFMNAQLPLLKVAALYFDKLVLLDPVGASWAVFLIASYLPGQFIFLIGVQLDVRLSVKIHHE